MQHFGVNFGFRNLHYICIITWAKMCIFGQKCAKLCIADVFFNV